METRARYVIIGAFVIAVIVAGFGFVYWLQNVGGLGARAYYRIRFEQPVSGLQPGAGVLFNGLKVGVVQRLGLDPSDLGGLVATISVEPWTPIRADTKVQITFQGLTGSPAILLRGGTSSAPRLVSLNGEIPTLDAPGDIGKNLSDSARDALANVNRVINENSKPLHSAITGISTFADMLGRNSKKIEGMLDGLGKMLGVGGGAKVQPKTYDLAAATAFPTIDKSIKVQMAVADVHAILAYDTQKILVRSAQGTFSDVEDGRWADNLPKLMQAKVIESFENAHLLGKVSRPFDMMEAPYKLELTIRNFQMSPGPNPEATVEFSARILGGKGTVLDARIFKATAPANGTNAAEAVPALDKAFAKTASELVAWSVDKLSTAAAGNGGGKAGDDMGSPDMPGNDSGMPELKMPAPPK
jgi:phospholipid/cholesterol/gamma-HCH transport system substrate-binding protein